MQYVSTRDESGRTVGFIEALMSGTALDKGLYVPDHIPHADLDLMREMSSYAAWAVYIINMFVGGEISASVVRKIVVETYTEANFGTKKITPVTWLESDLGLLHLSGGPTLAFKDLAMKLVARLMDYVLGTKGERATIVVATSGDTGGAAVDAFRGLKNIDLVTLFPKGRVSRVQQRMMTTATESNIHAIEVDGTFDDCQRMVKDMFNDHAFKELVKLSGVNSINWGRIVAQMIYWFACYFYSTTRNSEQIRVAIGCGNFGNAYSADFARHMGLPIEKIIMATNVNDILARLFRTGVYELRDVIATTSPSMDIQVSSNFERFLYDCSGHNGEFIAQLYDELAHSRSFNASFALPSLAVGWTAGTASEQEVLDTIKLIHDTFDEVIDPHTAVAMKVALENRKLGRPMVVAETAKAAKFPDAVFAAIGERPKMPEAWAHLESRPERKHGVGTDSGEVKEYITRLAA